MRLRDERADQRIVLKEQRRDRRVFHRSGKARHYSKIDVPFPQRRPQPAFYYRDAHIGIALGDILEHIDEYAIRQLSRHRADRATSDDPARGAAGSLECAIDLLENRRRLLAEYGTRRRGQEAMAG